jgi:hypothetical protein
MSRFKFGKIHWDIGPDGRPVWSVLFPWGIEIRETEQEALTASAIWHFFREKKMTIGRKHFRKIAAEIREIADPSARTAASVAVGKALREMNPRFDWSIWEKACDVEGLKVSPIL